MATILNINCKHYDSFFGKCNSPKMPRSRVLGLRRQCIEIGVPKQICPIKEPHPRPEYPKKPNIRMIKELESESARFTTYFCTECQNYKKFDIYEGDPKYCPDCHSTEIVEELGCLCNYGCSGTLSCLNSLSSSTSHAISRKPFDKKKLKKYIKARKELFNK